MGIIDKGRLIYIGTITELLEIPQGKVWEVTCSPEQAEELRHHYPVTLQTVVAGGKRIRLFSESRPADQAQPVEPTLEDAYLYVRRTRARKD